MNNNEKDEMRTFDIRMREGVVDTIEAKTAEDAIVDFAINMDSDMNNYFEAVLHDEKAADKNGQGNKRIEIDLGFGTLVAEICPDSDYREILLGIENKSGVWIQDLAIIGQKYHHDDNLEVIQDDGISVKVWSEVYNEDYTHNFDVEIYCEEPSDESL